MSEYKFFVNVIHSYLETALRDLNEEIINAAWEGELVKRDVINTEIDTLDALCKNKLLLATGARFTICNCAVSAKNFGNLCMDGVDYIPQFYLEYENEATDTERKTFDCRMYKGKYQ